MSTVAQDASSTSGWTHAPLPRLEARPARQLVLAGLLLGGAVLLDRPSVPAANAASAAADAASVSRAVPAFFEPNYLYRIVATNQNGTTAGALRSVTTTTSGT